ncbi:MAG: hypothetical protein HQL73_02215 [Magnetococcales bacterium]|nr:hypothetical protein [Magnetococcales bacterium]
MAQRGALAGFSVDGHHRVPLFNIFRWFWKGASFFITIGMIFGVEAQGYDFGVFFYLANPAFVYRVGQRSERNITANPLLTTSGRSPMVPNQKAAITLVKSSGIVASKSFPAKLISGQILGLSLATVNPWILLGLGAIGGYFYSRKKRFTFF